MDLRLQSTITADENTQGLFILQNILRRYKASTAKNAAICAAIWEGKKNYTKLYETKKKKLKLMERILSLQVHLKYTLKCC